MLQNLCSALVLPIDTTRIQFATNLRLIDFPFFFAAADTRDKRNRFSFYRKLHLELTVSNKIKKINQVP